MTLNEEQSRPVFPGAPGDGEYLGSILLGRAALNDLDADVYLQPDSPDALLVRIGAESGDALTGSAAAWARWAALFPDDDLWGLLLAATEVLADHTAEGAACDPE